MEIKVLRHGTHIPGNDHDGYMYSFNTSKGYNFDSHLHKCYEIIHVIHGSFIYTVEGREYRISDGDIVITSPDELHSFSFPEECAYQREFPICSIRAARGNLTIFRRTRLKNTDLTRFLTIYAHHAKPRPPKQTRLFLQMSFSLPRKCA